MGLSDKARITTAQRTKAGSIKGGAKSVERIDQLVEELKSDPELFFRLSTEPQATVERMESLDDNQKALLRIVNPGDLVKVGFHGPGDIAACGGSCGASCGGSCGASCGASCGGSCGGSCGASCAGSCVASCAASCVASCVASGAMPAQDEWLTLPADQRFADTVELASIVRQEIGQFSAFVRGGR